MRTILGLTLVATVAGLTSCTSVTVKKVHGENADEVEGFRYYLPRPYLAVSKPFPVGGDDLFVSGTLDAQGNVVSVDKKQLPQQLRDLFGDGSAESVHIPAASIVVSEEQAKIQPGPDDSKTGKGTSGGSAAPVASQQPTATPGAGAGVTTSSSSNHPLVKVNDSFDVIFMPDFDEQYAVKASGIWGTASMNMSFGEGWMVEQAQTTVDSGLQKFVSQTTSQLLGLAQTVAGALAAPPGVSTLASLLKPTTGAQEQAKVLQDKQTVLLRVRYVIEAQPGLYPVLKPGERKMPQPGPEPMTGTMSSKPYTYIPYGPFTVVAYNVRRTVLIELVTPSSQLRTAKPSGSALVGLTPKDITDLTTWLASNGVKSAFSGDLSTAYEAFEKQFHPGVNRPTVDTEPVAGPQVTVYVDKSSTLTAEDLLKLGAAFTKAPNRPRLSVGDLGAVFVKKGASDAPQEGR